MVRVQGALALHPPSAFASHTSAARVHDVPLPLSPTGDVSVLAAGDRRRRAGIRNHVVSPAAEVVSIGGTRASSVARTLVELGELLTLVDLVVVGDALVRMRRITPQQLVHVCERATGPGARAARRAASYVRDRVDPRMETRLRMLIVLAGLPEQTVDHRIREEDGRVRYRFDLSYPELRILVEYDGRQHRADLDQWDHDTRRKDWLDAQGWLHVPVFSRGIYVTRPRPCDVWRPRCAPAARAPPWARRRLGAHFPVH